MKKVKDLDELMAPINQFTFYSKLFVSCAIGTIAAYTWFADGAREPSILNYVVVPLMLFVFGFGGFWFVLSRDLGEIKKR